ncbi:MAG: dihydropteroate synthase [Muribaculaceae bacterium]|nr:dihydropteroate synthase [Muribaculaceae bacterium]
MFTSFTLNIKGRLISWNRPAVMGILNVTPDSFYADSRAFENESTDRQAARLIEEGADMIDIGGYSSRPGADDVCPDEELRRLEQGIAAVRRLNADIPISVDTFRADVALKAVTQLGADIINDISGGTLDDKMIDVVASTHAPYIMMHMRGTPADMQQHTDYNNVTCEVVDWLSRQLAQFSLAGAGDIIIDPGFGFSKTTDQNFEMLASLPLFNSLGRPILVGISRKSMIYKSLDITPAESLNGTTVINTLALERGASILRVHDVAAARQVVKLVGLTSNQKYC